MMLIFIGPAGAGKGTQCQRLAAHLKIPHLSTGEMLRKEREAHSKLGRLADQYMSRGELVPDPLILEMVGRRLEEPDCRKGVLLDGFPRTVNQAESLDRSLAEVDQAVDLVLELRVDDEELVRRLSSRGRKDDKPHVIKQRLTSYWRQTNPLLDYYNTQGLVDVIQGTGTPDEVFERILAAVERRRSGKRPAEGADER